MTTVLLVRHGRSTANTSGVLAGCTPGVNLDDRGREQAESLAVRLGGLKISAIVTSPLERCRQTIQPLADKLGLDVAVDDRLMECRYGDWTGQPLKDLMKDKLWKAVQAHPSSVRFPGEGAESILEMSARAVSAVRDWDIRLGALHGPGAVWVACSHGDLIKALVADALGMHLDMFQRVVVDPGSVSALRYTDLRPFAVRVNDVGGDVSAYQPPKQPRRRRSSDAAVGGGAGSTA